MAMRLTKEQGWTLPPWRPDDKEYFVAAPNGIGVHLYWSELSLTQKRHVIADEQRVVYDALFDPNGLNNL